MSHIASAYELHGRLPGLPRTTFGHRRADGVDVALKAAHGGDPGSRQALQHELELLQSTGGSHVTRALEIIELGGLPHLVTTLPAGRRLGELLDDPTVDLDERLAIAAALATALADLHARRIVHQDLRPETCVITPEGDAVFCDLEWAERLPPGQDALYGPGLRGSPRYLAPEQSGRMSRGRDTRADLYVLGGVLHELLTGRPPFEADSPDELVYRHLAVTPEPLAAARPDLPRPVCALVQRLLEKDPARRYQTATGVREDLRSMRQILQQGHPLDGFELGRHELRTDVTFSTRAYGREAELRALDEALDRCCTEGLTVVDVSGDAGVGKTLLVSAFEPAVVGRGGQLVAGRFEPRAGPSPFPAIADALEDLAQRWLTLSSAELDRLRSDLLPLGSLAQALIRVVPTLAHVLPAPADVDFEDGLDTRGRLALGLRRLIATTTSADSPLVIVLDDAHNADSHSLQLLQEFVAPRKLPGLLVVTAGRKRSAPSPLDPLVDTSVTLGDLPVEALCDSVADALQLTPEAVVDLAGLIADRAGTNPLSFRSLFRHLVHGGAIHWQGAGGWSWSLEEIRSSDLPADAAEATAARLSALPEPTRALLEVASCMGTSVHLDELAAVQDLEPSDAHTRLLPALEAGVLVQRGPGRLQFPHERIHEACAARLSPNAQTEIFDRLGRVLLARTTERDLEGAIYRIVDVLERGHPPETEAGQLRLADLHRIAGQRAERDAAFRRAKNHYAAGSALLGDTPFQDGEAIAFPLLFGRARTLWLSGRREEGAAAMDALMARSLSAPAFGAVVAWRAQAIFLDLDTPGKALDIAIAGLRHLGVRVPRRPNPAQIAIRVLRVMTQVGTCEKLIELDAASDPGFLGASTILQRSLGIAYMSREIPTFICLWTTQLLLARRHGLNPDVGEAMANLALFRSVIFNDARSGWEIGSLAAKVHERLNGRNSTLVAYLRGAFLEWRVRPAAAAASRCFEAWHTAMERGVFVDAGAAFVLYTPLAVHSGLHLDTLLDVASSVKGTSGVPLFDRAHELTHMLRTTTRFLRGEIDVDAADPFELEGRPLEDQFSVDARVVYAATLISLGAWARAYDILEPVALNIGQIAFGRITASELAFIQGISAGALAGKRPKAALRKRITRHRGALKKLAKGGARHLAYKARALDAEHAAISGRTDTAAALMQQAVELAEQEGAHHHAGWLLLRRADLLTKQELHREAEHLRDRAAGCFERWGATAAAARLRAQGPESTPGIGALDQAAIVDALHAVSQELDLESLVPAVLEVALHHTGAPRGILLLADEREGLIAVGERTASGATTRLDTPLDRHDAIARSVVHLASRTLDLLVVEDAQSDPRFRADPYVQGSAVRSAMCLPFARKGVLTGAIYLENPLAPAAFTPAHAGVLTMLGAQAAISLQNARLYHQVAAFNETLEHKVHLRTEQLRDAKRATEEAGRAKERFFAMMSHEIRTPLNGVLGMAQLLEDTRLDAEQREFVDVIRGSGSALLTVIDDLLDFSKLEAGKLDLEETAFDLADVVEEVAKLFAPKAQARGVRLLVHLEPGLPTRVTGDPTRVRQVLMNFVGNAVKFTAEGRILIRAGVAASGAIRLEVQDSGIGLTDDQRARLFTPFVQADSSTTRRYGGTGLGLVICKQLTEAMGGRIGVDSTPGVGSTFWYELPLPGAPAQSAVVTGPRVVVVDEDPVGRAAHEALVHGLGLTLTTEDPNATWLVRAPADPTALQARLAELAHVRNIAWIADLHERTALAVRLPEGATVLGEPVRRSELAHALGLSREGSASRRARPQSLDLHVLLVEDNVVNQTIAVRMLERAGCRVSLAGDGIEAIEAFERETFDVILMDCNMPRMDGYEATMRIRALEQGRDAHTPIVAMTAGAGAGDRARCFEHGMDDFLTKPIDGDAVLASLRAWTRVEAPAPGQARGA